MTAKLCQCDIVLAIVADTLAGIAKASKNRNHDDDNRWELHYLDCLADGGFPRDLMPCRIRAARPHYPHLDSITKVHR